MAGRPRERSAEGPCHDRRLKATDKRPYTATMIVMSLACSLMVGRRAFGAAGLSMIRSVTGPARPGFHTIPSGVATQAGGYRTHSMELHGVVLQVEFLSVGESRTACCRMGSRPAGVECGRSAAGPESAAWPLHGDGAKTQEDTAVAPHREVGGRSTTCIGWNVDTFDVEALSPYATDT